MKRTAAIALLGSLALCRPTEARPGRTEPGAAAIVGNRFRGGANTYNNAGESASVQIGLNFESGSAALGVTSGCRPTNPKRETRSARVSVCGN